MEVDLSCSSYIFSVNEGVNYLLIKLFIKIIKIILDVYCCVLSGSRQNRAEVIFDSQ